MTYLENELSKIKYSKLNFFIYISVALYTALLFAMYTYFDSDRSIFLFHFKVFSGLSYLIFVIIPVSLISFLFAKEYEDRTMVYILLRPTSIFKLFVSKIAVVIKIMNKIIIISTIFTFVYGLFIFQLEPLTITDTFLQSILKSVILMVYTYVCILMYIGFTVLLNVIIKKFVISSVVATLISILSNIVTIRITVIGNSFKIPLSTLLSPASYYEIPFNDFLVRCGTITLINLVVIFIFLLTAYGKYRKARGAE